jgi:hypothetical protein
MTFQDVENMYSKLYMDYMNEKIIEAIKKYNNTLCPMRTYLTISNSDFKNFIAHKNDTIIDFQELIFFNKLHYISPRNNKHHGKFFRILQSNTLIIDDKPFYLIDETVDDNIQIFITRIYPEPILLEHNLNIINFDSDKLSIITFQDVENMYSKLYMDYMNEKIKISIETHDNSLKNTRTYLKITNDDFHIYINKRNNSAILFEYIMSFEKIHYIQNKDNDNHGKYFKMLQNALLSETDSYYLIDETLPYHDYKIFITKERIKPEHLYHALNVI